MAGVPGIGVAPAKEANVPVRSMFLRGSRAIYILFNRDESYYGRGSEPAGAPQSMGVGVRHV